MGTRHGAAASATLAPDIDLIEIGRGDRASRRRRRDRGARGRATIRGAAPSACATCGRCSRALATTLVATPLLPYFDLANIVMLFLLTVVLVALKWGRGPAVLAAFVSVAAFDFFFVPPRFSFAVSDFQYLLTFAVMLAVALIIGQMTAGLRYQARIASYREERARVALRIRARHVEPAADRRRRRHRGARSSRSTFRAKVAILVPGRPGPRLRPHAAAAAALAVDVGAAQWAYDKAQPAGAGTDTLAGSEFLYLPLRAPMRTRGVLVIKPRQSAAAARARAAAAARHVRRADRDRARARALRRGRAAGAASTWNPSGCAIRCSSALSHDLRTPLAALVGLGRVAGADHAAAVGRSSSTPRTRSPRRRGG